MKRWFVPVVETRAVNMEYVVEAETMDEAIRLALSGETIEEAETFGWDYDVTDRNLNLSRQVEEQVEFRRVE